MRCPTTYNKSKKEKMENTKSFEVVYEATAVCITHVDALSEESAINMVRTGEAVDVTIDHVMFERTVKGICETPTTMGFLTNSDPGDEL